MLYKSEWYDKKVITMDRFFASSKTCSVCGQIKQGLTLSDRTYKCDCINIMNRDLNASRNIHIKAVGIQAAQQSWRECKPGFHPAILNEVISSVKRAGL